MSVVLGRVYHVPMFVAVVAYTTRTCGTCRCRLRRRRRLLLYTRRRRWDDGAAAAVHTAQLSRTLFRREGGSGLLQRGIRCLAVVAATVVRVCRAGPPTKIVRRPCSVVQCVFVQTCTRVSSVFGVSSQCRVPSQYIHYIRPRVVGCRLRVFVRVSPSPIPQTRPLRFVVSHRSYYAADHKRNGA